MAVPNAQLDRVLIVDDDAEMARELAGVLDTLQCGVVVDTAFDFGAAFSKVRQTRYGTVIVDYKMPGLNGMDLAQAVRCISPDTRVVLMTKSETRALRETAQLLDFTLFLVKPFRLVQLRQLFGRENGKLDNLRRILLLEQEHGLRHRYGDALREADYGVNEAATLEEAADLFGIRRFDVFICALDANGERVTDFVRQQRSMLRAAGTQIIGITSNGGYDSNWEEMGIDFYLQTPVATDSLVTLVERITSSNGSMHNGLPE